jgi:aspartate/methionine/tyrosine aminotransferase
MERIPASGTLRMFELAKKREAKGHKIYHLEVGEPDFPTPANVVDAGIKALNEGHTKYVSSRGAPPLLDAIADYYNQRDIKIDGQENVIVTPGAKLALFSGIMAAIDSGDEVLCLSPAWPTYRVMIRMVGAKPVDVPMSPDFQLDEEALKNAMTRTVTALIINSPSNPTGGVLTKEHLKIIYDLACDHDFVVFSDEIYESLVYDGFQQASMLDVDPDMKRSLIINGFSKSYAMTGWRLGYAIGNPKTIDNMIRIQQNTTSCAADFSQIAAVEALRGDQTSIEKMKVAYQKRRDVITQLFCDMDGVNCISPKGAFYVFPDFSEYNLSSTTLAELLLKKVGVVGTPGVAFGNAYDAHLRFSYSASMSDIQEGITKLKEYLPSLK